MLAVTMVDKTPATHTRIQVPVHKYTRSIPMRGNKSAAIMAQKTDLVASALNRITDRVFVDALSSSDRAAMSELVADFFCDDESTDDGNESEEEALPSLASINDMVDKTPATHTRTRIQVPVHTIDPYAREQISSNHGSKNGSSCLSPE